MCVFVCESLFLCVCICVCVCLCLCRVCLFALSLRRCSDFCVSMCVLVCVRALVNWCV